MSKREVFQKSGKLSVHLMKRVIFLSISGNELFHHTNIKYTFYSLLIYWTRFFFFFLFSSVLTHANFNLILQAENVIYQCSGMKFYIVHSPLQMQLLPSQSFWKPDFSYFLSNLNTRGLIVLKIIFSLHKTWIRVVLWLSVWKIW